MLSKSAYTLPKVAQKKKANNYTRTLWYILNIKLISQYFFPRNRYQINFPRIYIILSLLPMFTFKAKLLIENTRMFVQSALSLKVFCHWIFRNISFNYQVFCSDTSNSSILRIAALCWSLYFWMWSRFVVGQVFYVKNSMKILFRLVWIFLLKDGLIYLTHCSAKNLFKILFIF